MFIFGNFLVASANVIDMLLTIFYWLILLRAIISWVNPDPFNPIVQFLYRVTEPVLEPIRRFLPSMGIDISPLIVFILIMFLKPFLVNSLLELGWRLR